MTFLSATWRRLRTLITPRWERWDSTEAEVLQFADELLAVRQVVHVGDVPIVPGLGEPTLVLPTLSHRSDETATTPLGYRPRHAALDVRDVNRAAIRSVTREFAALVRDNFGVHVTGRAPVEAELVREWAEVAT